MPLSCDPPAAHAAALPGPASSRADGIIATGVVGLDATLGPCGFHRGSSARISGAAGTGKSMLAASIIDAACRRGERCMAFMFEESGALIIRNAHSIGLDLDMHVSSGRLRFEAARPSLFGVETHLARMHRDLDQFPQEVVVIDPAPTLCGPAGALQATLLRMIDLVKARHHGVLHHAAQ